MRSFDRRSDVDGQGWSEFYVKFEVVKSELCDPLLSPVYSNTTTAKYHGVLLREFRLLTG